MPVVSLGPKTYCQSRRRSSRGPRAIISTWSTAAWLKGCVYMVCSGGFAWNWKVLDLKGETARLSDILFGCLDVFW